MAKRRSYYQERLNENIEELRELYMKLYDDKNAFEYFLGLLKKAYHERKASLRRRDIASIENPERKLSQDMLGMMLYTENFAGELSNVSEKLPYLRECGVSYLHLMPLLKSSLRSSPLR